MKIRSGFVSNSSSSSFILAFRKDCTREDIAKAIEESSDSVARFLNDYDETDPDMGNSIVDFLYGYIIHPHLDLGDWKVSSDEFGSEEFSEGAYIYGYAPDFNTDKFKIVGSW